MSSNKRLETVLCVLRLCRPGLCGLIGMCVVYTLAMRINDEIDAFCLMRQSYLTQAIQFSYVRNYYV